LRVLVAFCLIDWRVVSQIDGGVVTCMDAQEM